MRASVPISPVPVLLMNDLQKHSDTISLPLLSFILTEETLNRIIESKDFPLRLLMEEKQMVLLYDNRSAAIPLSAQLFISSVQLNFPTLSLSVEKMTMMNSLPIPKSALHLAAKRYPSLSFSDDRIHIALDQLLPGGSSIESGELEIDTGLLVVTLENFSLPLSLFP